MQYHLGMYCLFLRYNIEKVNHITNIRVTNTQMIKDGFPNGWSNNFAANLPMKRNGDSDEIADLALYLASEQSSYINGETSK